MNLKGMKINKRTIKGLSNALMATAVKHYPEILTGIGVTGMFGAVAASVVATHKADEKIVKQEKELKRSLTKTEVIQEVWTEYIPPVVMTAVSAACILGANKVHEKRNAALAAAYVLSESQAADLKNKIEEMFGEKTAKEIQHEINKDKIESNPVSESKVIVTGKGTTKCFDVIAGRYFESDIETLRQGAYCLTQRLYNEMYISVNEFYDEVGLDHAIFGDDMGWNVDDGAIELSFDAQLDESNHPCLVMDFVTRPRYKDRGLL